MRLTVLGSSDASGIPRADCRDPACVCARALAGQAPGRRNACALIAHDGVQLAIDTGLGFQQCQNLLLTHYHPDHAGHHEQFAGIPAWGPADGVPDAPPGEAGVDYFPRPPGVSVVEPFCTFDCGPFQCTPLPLNHPIPVYGWVVAAAGMRIAWLTDTYGIPSASLAWLVEHSCTLIALDTTFVPGTTRAPLRGHGDLTASLAALAAAAPTQGLLIHIGHELQTWLDAERPVLPPSITVAHDDQVIEFSHQ